MYQCHGFIRDYDPASNTATVELVGVGIIDTWITGMQIHAALSPGQLAGGVPVVVEMPDPHRICEATITSIWQPVAASTGAGGAAVFNTTGRAVIATDGTGAGSVTVSFGHTYTSDPTVTASVDGRITPTITGVTTTGATIKITGALANASYKCTWTASGT